MTRPQSRLAAAKFAEALLLSTCIVLTLALLSNPINATAPQTFQWPNNIMFKLNTYNTYVRFHSSANFDQLSFGDANINFTVLQSNRPSPLSSLGFQIQNGNLTVESAGDSFVQVTIYPGSTATLTVYCLAMGQPSSVTYPYVWSNNKVIIATNKVTTVNLQWGEIVTAATMKLLFLIGGFGMLFVPIALIVNESTRPEFPEMIIYLFVSVVGVGLLGAAAV